MTCSKITKCRVCKGSKFKEVINLGNMKLTGIFPKSVEDFIDESPLRLIKCDNNIRCNLVQLEHSYAPQKMFGVGYGYRSGLNQGMVAHLKDKIEYILNKTSPQKDSIIIDIGSNDGTTLGFYPPGEFKLIGIDPSIDQFKKYYREDINKIADFFSFEKVAPFFTGHQKAKIITSFSMFYDLEDPVGFASQISKSLSEDGVWVFEQSYLPSMIQQNSFDTICHEHLEYYSLKQIYYILSLVGMEIIDLSFNEVNGGSFSVTASKKAAFPFQQFDLIKNKLEEEEVFLSEETFNNFTSKIANSKNDLMSAIKQLRKKGKKLFGLGASTKGNVLLQYFNLTAHDIEAIGEVNEDKFGCVTPGTRIPIIDEKLLIENNKDAYFLVLPWHFKNFFCNAHKYKGLNLIFPLPNLKIIKND